MITYPCGCVNEVHGLSGIVRSVVKCDFHQRYARDPATLDEAYYTELAHLDGSGELVNSTHLAELAEALGPFPYADGRCQSLEIGCGVSPYVEAIRQADWDYTGLDVSAWVASWICDHWKVKTIVANWEMWDSTDRFGLILCAHALEHMMDAPAALDKMVAALEPSGELWIVVPDDSDPVNPYHLWFFNERTLRAAIEATGLTILRLVVRSIVPREQFLFVRARKP